MASPDRDELRDRILEEALGLEGAEQAAYVRQACGADEELRAEIERLLGLAAGIGDGFLESSGGGAAVPVQRIGRYEIQAEIGVGGAGRVFEARDTQIQRTVALKLLETGAFSSSEQNRARFLREVRMLGSINHENVVQLYDCGEFEGRLYLVMEFLRGQDLRGAMESNQCGDTAQRLETARQIVAGLAHIHEAGIIHRDLKPANIFVLPSGRVKLMDFGIAYTDGLNLTTAGSIAGTPAYMAPEQIEGKKLTAATDVHALGVTLYELLSGKRAFAGDTMAAIFHQVLAKPLPLEPLRAAGVPEAVTLFVARCLEKDPAVRPTDLRGDFERALQGVKPPPLVMPRAPVPRRKLLYGLGGVAGAAVLGAGAYQFVLPRLRSSGIRSVAVLPFANGTGDAKLDYLSTGLTEGLITSLGYLKGLMVTARSAVLAYQGKTVDPREVAQRLGVEGVLTGAVGRQGESFTVVAELAEGRTAAHVWGTRQVVREAELAGAHGAIAADVAGTLGLKPQQSARQAFEKQTANSSAYQDYLYGRYALNRRRMAGYTQAVTYFRKAVEADPAFALAWSGLADAYAFQGGPRPPKEVFPLAKEAAERALRVNPNLAEAHASAGLIHLQYDWDWAAAEREFQAALALNENDTAAGARYGRLLMALGRFEQAERELLRVQKLDPVSITTRSALANCHYLSRQYDKALVEIRRALELEPNFVLASDILADILVEQKRYAEAIAIYEKEVAGQPDDAGALASLARAAILAKETAKAGEAIRRFEALAASKPINPSAAALLAIARGKLDDAIGHLQQGYQDRYWPLIFLKVSPLWDPLRNRPEFQNLLKAMNLA